MYKYIIFLLNEFTMEIREKWRPVVITMLVKKREANKLQGKNSFILFKDRLKPMRYLCWVKNIHTCAGTYLFLLLYLSLPINKRQFLFRFWQHQGRWLSLGNVASLKKQMGTINWFSTKGCVVAWCRLIFFCGWSLSLIPKSFVLQFELQ